MSTPLQDPSDEELIVRALRGDAGAFGALYDRYLDQVYRYIFYRVGDTQLAEDLTETVFLKTWETLSKRKKAVDNFRAWLFRSAHNLVIDHYRTRKADASLEQAFDLHDQIASPEAQVQAGETTQALIQAINALDPQQQQVISCRFISGMSHAQTAKVMGLNEGHVRVLQHRALKRMRSLLGSEGNDRLRTS